MFKGLSAFGSLLKQAQQMGQRMHDMNEELRKRRVTGTAGGEMVEVEVNGLLEVLRCRIQPQLLNSADQELLEDLVVAATNQALAKARQHAAEAMKELGGGLEVPPGMEDLLHKLLGDQGSHEGTTA
jgi:DNA-binding YbaB/EbfC family protein